DFVLRRRLVALDAGIAEVAGVQERPKTVDVRAGGEAQGDLGAAGEVDPELRAPDGDREKPDEDQRPGGPDGPPLPAEEIKVRLAKKFHTASDRKRVDVLPAAVLELEDRVRHEDSGEDGDQESQDQGH